MKLKSKKITTGTTLLWIVIIFILCAIPGEDIPNPRLNIPQLDKVVHFGMFFIMSALLSLTLEQHTRFTLKKIYFISIATAFTYGGLIEILQHYFFSRGGDIWDWLADISGAVVGCISYPLIKRILHIEN